VYVSAFELYRIGPGPSSSNTVGPQRAGLRFVHDLAADGLLHQTARVEAELYGGLAFSGREQATDQAVIAGLSGQPPERCDAAIDRPSDLSGHKTTRQNIDALKKPESTHQNHHNAHGVQNDSHCLLPRFTLSCRRVDPRNDSANVNEQLTLTVVKV
jgi:hypothetical protein